VILDWAAEQAGWHVPLHAALDGLTAAQAAWRPAGGDHSIRQITEHLRFWKRKVIRSLEGETWLPTPGDDATFQDPGDPADEPGWSALCADLRQAHADLKRVADRPGPADLLIWVATHDSYHTGQIVLLRKLQGAWPGRA